MIALAIAVAICAASVERRVVAQVASQPGGAQAAERAAGPVLDKLNRRGDLTLREATLESALFTISNLWGVNIVAGSVEGSVNGVFTDAPLREILDSILLSNGYAYRPVGGSLVVSRLQELGQINPFFISETIPVGSAEVGEVVEAARLMSTPQGQVRALPSAGALLVVDFPDRVEKIRDLVRQLDVATRNTASSGGGGVGGAPGPRQLEVAYFRLHYVTALQASAAIEVVLSASGRASAVEEEDRLLVVDYPENVRMIEAVLGRIDRPRPQVNIKSLIYDISLSDAEQIGVNWNGITNGAVDQATGIATGQNTGLRFLTQTASPLDSSGTGGAFSFYSFEGNLDLRAVIIALQQAEDSRLLADPNVTVMDNEAASIESISEIPFQQLTQTTGGGNIGTTSFKEVGIKLDVTPKIARDGTIDMTVVPEFSRLAGFTPGDNQPIVETRRATTRVRVANGQTVMIAGLRQRTDVGDFDGVPLLKDIRFVGHLFRSRDTQIEESELVVFITPEIVGYQDCPSERNRLSSETVGCRLDMIPAAEGCPSCQPYGSCVEGPCFTDGVCDPNEIPAPAVDETGPAPQPTRVEELAPRDAAAPVEVVPPLPVDHGAAVRRLPGIDGQQPPATAMAGDGAAVGGALPEKPLRVGYDSRFRATGGLHPGSQRVSERPAPPPAAKTAKRKTGDWLFWR